MWVCVCVCVCVCVLTYLLTELNTVARGSYLAVWSLAELVDEAQTVWRELDDGRRRRRRRLVGRGPADQLQVNPRTTTATRSHLLHHRRVAAVPAAALHVSVNRSIKKIYKKVKVAHTRLPSVGFRS